MHIKTYYYLTKPGIIYGNAITATGGFFLASKGNFDVLLFLATLIGLSLVIASACVFNNYIDRGIDEKMARTKNRALVKKLISPFNALAYGTVLGLIGFLVLFFHTNLLATLLGATGFFFYVVVYGIYKRKSIYGTLVGSISGAIPPVVGYCAVSNNFDIGAIIFFIILVLWQMPHFYAIAIYRYKDYANASIPVLPIKKGIHTTKVHMLFYITAFIIASTALTTFGLTGYIYLVVMSLLGLKWLLLAVKGFTTEDDGRWARKMFSFSLIVITALCVLISVDAVR